MTEQNRQKLLRDLRRLLAYYGFTQVGGDGVTVYRKDAMIDMKLYQVGEEKAQELCELEENRT